MLVLLGLDLSLWSDLSWTLLPSLLPTSVVAPVSHYSPIKK